MIRVAALYKAASIDSAGAPVTGRRVRIAFDFGKTMPPSVAA